MPITTTSNLSKAHVTRDSIGAHLGISVHRAIK